MLSKTFHRCQCVIQVAIYLQNQVVIVLDLLGKQCVEWLVSHEWNVIFIALRCDSSGNLIPDFLNFCSEVFIDLSVSSIGFDLSESRLLGSFYHELVLVGALHNILGYVCESLDGCIFMEAEKLGHIF